MPRLHGCVVHEPVVEVEGEPRGARVRPRPAHERAEVRTAREHQAMQRILLRRRVAADGNDHRGLTSIERRVSACV